LRGKIGGSIAADAIRKSGASEGPLSEIKGDLSPFLRRIEKARASLRAASRSLLDFDFIQGTRRRHAKIQ